MSRTVHKFAFSGDGAEQVISMPIGAKIVEVSDQGGEICLWAIVPTKPLDMIARKFLVIGTGWEIPEGPLTHVGTVHQRPYAWHIFEVGGPDAG